MPRIEPLPWDSAFFGAIISRLRLDHAEEAELAAAVDESDRRGIQCLYWLVDSSDLISSTSASRLGFRLVDLRVTLDVCIAPAPEPPDPGIRTMTAADLPALTALARASHRDSRFFRDGNFATSRCEALYEEWLRKSFLEGPGTVLVAEKDGAPAGYCTCDLRENAGSIGLLAVDPRWRRERFGTALVQGAVDFFRAAGAGHATVVTQGHNIASQRLYQRAGFVTSSIQLWYHRWRPDR